MKFAEYGSLITSVFAGKFHPQILAGSPSKGVKQGMGGKKVPFSSSNVNILKTVEDTSKLLLTTNRKSHVRFLLIPRSMTIDDLDLL